VEEKGERECVCVSVCLREREWGEEGERNMFDHVKSGRQRETKRGRERQKKKRKGHKKKGERERERERERESERETCLIM